MAEARITEFFGETQIREEVLDFMEFGSRMPREAWRLPSPQMLQELTELFGALLERSVIAHCAVSCAQ